MIRCIAIDDEPRALQVIQEHANRASFVTLLASFTDPFAAVEFANQHAVDLILLDIHMPDITGDNLVSLFTTNPLIIFTTAHSEYALKSYDLDAVDYLLKPFDYARFLKALTKVRDRLQPTSRPPAEFIFVNTGHRRERIDLADLLYLEGEGNYVRYQAKKARYLVRTSIKEALKSLPEHRFAQIHRSFIVALQAIERIEENRVVIAGKSLPIGSTYRTPFMQTIERLQG